jgi:Flp pilus assembly protein TadD
MMDCLVQGIRNLDTHPLPLSVYRSMIVEGRKRKLKLEPNFSMGRRRLFGVFFFCVLGLSASALGAEAKPLNRKQIVSLLQGSVSPKRIANLIEQRGIDFEPSSEDVQALQQAKASEAVINAVRAARQVLPKEVLLERHRAKAREFEGRGAAADAESEYRAALQLDPADATLHAGLARVLGQQKKWTLAIGSYRESLHLRPGDYETSYQLGVALRESGDPAGAINAWTEALKYKQDDPRIFDDLGRAFAERRDWRRTAVAYRALARLRPDSATAFMELGIALRNGGDPPGALAAFREAVRLNSNDPIAHNNLGFALEERGEVQAAFEQYQLAVQLNPRDPSIKSNFERASQKLKRPSLVK